MEKINIVYKASRTACYLNLNFFKHPAHFKFFVINYNIGHVVTVCECCKKWFTQTSCCSIHHIY